MKMKTGTKSGMTMMVSPLSGSRIPTGAHPGNTGGKKGRSGRKPLDYKAKLAKILESPEHAQAVRAILTDAEHAAFSAVQKTAIGYVYGESAAVAIRAADQELTKAVASRLLTMLDNQKQLDRLEAQFRAFAAQQDTQDAEVVAG